tara:strand:- start:1121 stop:1273 length:153 start_codon:yes stop_codon:yes gene_type:complete
MEKFNLFTFVRTNFFKIMGVFLVIGLAQYFMGCGAEETVVAESQEETDLK